MLNIFKKKSSVPATTAARVQAARDKVEDIMRVFSIMDERIDEALSEIEAAMTEDKQQIAALQKNHDRAADELQMNRALKEKLKEFIVR